MNILQAGIFGIVEGITEFLPVSSTFHLILTAKLLGVAENGFQKVFEIAIQSGAILAVATTFTTTLRNNRELGKKVLVAFIPTALVGFLLYSLIKNVFLENFFLQIGMFILVGILFILFEKCSSHSYLRSIADITYKEALLVGFAQSLAVIPGVSRAGAVILALMMLSVNRKDAALFSFLVAVPTILAAGIFDIVKSRADIATQQDVLLLAVGTIASFAVAHMTLAWLLKYLQTHTIALFGWYRIALGSLLILAAAYGVI